MTETEPSGPRCVEPATPARVDFRADGDRSCPHCGEVSLAFDPASERARCRSCGEAA